MPQLYSIFEQSKIISSVDTLKQSWQIYTARWKKFAGMVGLLYLGALACGAVIALFAGLSVLFKLSAGNGEFLSSNIAITASVAVIAIIGIIFFIVFSLLIQYGLVIMAAKVEEELSIREILKTTWTKLLNALWVSILTGLIVFAGFLLFIAPGIIWGIQYRFSIYACLVEDKKGMSALRRSKEIVKNYWWTTARRIIFWTIIAMLASFIAATPIIGWIGNLILPFVLTPLGIIYSYAVYANIRDLKEKGQEKEQVRTRDKVVTVLIILLPIILMALLLGIGISEEQRLNKYKQELEQKQEMQELDFD